jgi:hypothetical protein
MYPPHTTEPSCKRMGALTAACIANLFRALYCGPRELVSEAAESSGRAGILSTRRLKMSRRGGSGGTVDEQRGLVAWGVSNPSAEVSS